MTRRDSARGLTLFELLVVLVMLVFAVLLAGILLPGIGGRPHGGRQIKDSTQVRGIQQAMAIWANQNQGLFPLPSQVDVNNATVPELGEAKDTTANILSLLIYTGNISVELCVSPAEVNSSISMKDNYMFDAPVKAVDPANAMWDPSFSADFTNGKTGNTSYAHVLPGGGRGALWRDTFTTTEPIVGNRGPEIGSISRDAKGRVVAAFVDAGTNTFLIHGSRNSWQGNIAYNDGHVNFETRTDPDGVVYKDAAGKKWADCLFYDEPDDAAGLNAWMSIWVKAGAGKGDFRGIWD